MGSRVRIRLFDILHFVRDLLFPLLKISKSGSHMVHVPNFFWGGVSSWEDRGGDDNSIQIINIGRVGDKSFIEFLKNGGGGGGGRVSSNNILTFLILLAR